jgi:hypothetical protein
LNLAALASIAEHQGGNIFIGGIDSGEIGFGSTVGDFGDSGKFRTLLSLTTAPSAVREISSLPLLATITIAAVLIDWRRRAIRTHQPN